MMPRSCGSPGTFETPPMITVRPGRRLGVVTGPGETGRQPGPPVPLSERYLETHEGVGGAESEEPRPQPRPRAQTINHAMIGAAWTAGKTGRARQVPTVFR